MYLEQPKEGDLKDGSQSKEGEDSSEGLRVRLSSLRAEEGRGGRGKIKEAEISCGSSSPSLASVQISHTHTYFFTNTKPEKCVVES